MYGLYGLKHHTVEMLPCGTDEQQTREDKATQPLDAGRLSFAKTDDLVHKGFPHAVCFPSILGKWEFTIELQGFQPIVKVVKRENASFFHLSASLPS